MAMWGGRFQEATLAEFRDFNDSLSFDYLLAQQDIQASRAWAQQLAAAGIINHEEAAQLDAALADLAVAIEADAKLPLQTSEEDIHSWVEAQLTIKLGAVAKKLHTGRSRNDLVATDLRLWTKLNAQSARDALVSAIAALIAFADKAGSAVMPGFTHLQRAQPVLVSHWALAYVEMFRRDLSRIDDALARMDVCPLGCGALAGTGVAVSQTADNRLKLDIPSDISFDVGRSAMVARACRITEAGGASSDRSVWRMWSACWRRSRLAWTGRG